MLSLVGVSIYGPIVFSSWDHRQCFWKSTLADQQKYINEGITSDKKADYGDKKGNLASNYDNDDSISTDKDMLMDNDTEDNSYVSPPTMGP